jgi:hypothetical protein
MKMLMSFGDVIWLSDAEERSRVSEGEVDV